MLWNTKFQEYLTVKFDAHFSLWRIWMIYCGSISLAVATGLYSCFCPKPIKDFSSGFDLAQNESQHLAIMGLGKTYLKDVQTLEARCSPAERALFPRDRPTDNFIAQMVGRPQEPQVLGSLIVYTWRLHNIRYPRLRPIVLLIYAFGFSLLGVPAAITFLQVTFFGLGQLLASL